MIAIPVPELENHHYNEDIPEDLPQTIHDLITKRSMEIADAYQDIIKDILRFQSIEAPPIPWIANIPNHAGIFTHPEHGFARISSDSSHINIQLARHGYFGYPLYSAYLELYSDYERTQAIPPVRIDRQKKFDESTRPWQISMAGTTVDIRSSVQGMYDRVLISAVTRNPLLFYSIEVLK